MLQIKRVETKGDWDEFIDLPWKIYAGDPHWVPQLRIAVRDLLDVNKNPFFKHATMIAFLALKEGRVVGRVVGVIDENHNRFHQEKAAFFGFFESIEDSAVAKALLDEVARWSRERGIERLRGPLNPSTNHECGLLVEGFDDTPFVMMTYNPPYYSGLLEQCGLSKTMDLYAYELSKTTKFSDRILAHAERLKKRHEIRFRTLKMSEFEQEVDRLLEVYNDAWENNWGFVPMDREEFHHMAKDLKMVVDPRILLIAEVGQEVAGFALALPDVNRALQKVPDGKLFPTGIVKLLWHLKGPGRRKTIRRLRVVTLGIRKKYQNLGLGPLFYTEYVQHAPGYGYLEGEASWILESNGPMNRALEHMNARRTKTYRIYEKVLERPGGV